MTALRLKHVAEFQASAIHPDLWENFITLEDNKIILDHLLIGDLERTNTGKVSKAWLDKYHVLSSGWVVQTVGSDFVQFKPDEPRVYFNADGKASIVKYESPAKFATDIIRFRHLPHWITGGKSAEDWWQDVIDLVEEGWITEGAKKAASLVSLGFPAIALTGIYNTHTRKDGEVIPALREYVKNKKIINLVFDAPDKLTQHKDLENSYRRLKNLILEINPSCEVRICCWEWWKGKGLDDAVAAGHLNKESLQKSSLPYYEGLMFLNTNIPAFRRITGKRYLDLEDVDGFDDKYVALVAGKDSGKTTIISKYLKTLSSGEKVLSVTHRIKLGMQLAEILGLRYLNGKKNLSSEFLWKLILCINSLNLENVNSSDWENGTVLVLDEVVQLCDFIFSGTIKKAPEVMRNLSAILCAAKKVILSDADLDSKTIELIDELMPGCDFLKHLKVYEFKKDVKKIPMKVHKVSNRKVGAATYEASLAALLRGEKILVMVDSQRPTSKLSAETIKRALEKACKELTGNDVRGLAVYAEASKNKGHEASRIVTEGIDVVYQYDFVVYTTVIGTGISLDKDKPSVEDPDKIPYFDRVIGGFSGAIQINDSLQGLIRYRRGVPREVYLPNKGIAAAHAGSSYSRKVNQVNTSKIKAAVKDVYHAIAHQIPESDEINRPLEKYHAKLRAFSKYECDNYFDLFCKRASKDYELIVNEETQKIEVPTVLEDTVEEVFEEYAETTVNAKIIEDEKRYEEVKAKDVVLPKEAEDLRKTNLAKKYRIETCESLITKDLIILDSEMGYRSGIQNHYYLDKLYYAEIRGEFNIKRDLLDFEKYRKDPQIKAKLFVELGAQKLIDSAGESLHRFHPIVQEIIANYKHIEALQPGFIYRHLHLALNEKEPMKVIDSLALKLALKRKKAGRKVLPNREQVAQISYHVEDTIRYDLFKIWDENNDIDLVLSQMAEIRDAESQVLEKLRSPNTSEVEKESLRLELSESGKLYDALKEELQQMNEARNQRNLDFEVDRRQEEEGLQLLEDVRNQMRAATSEVMVY